MKRSQRDLAKEMRAPYFGEVCNCQGDMVT